jgi:flagellar basal body rod protein FlgB
VRSVDGLMASLAENAMAHNMAAQMLKNKYETLKSAITLRA